MEKRDFSSLVDVHEPSTTSSTTEGTFNQTLIPEEINEEDSSVVEPIHKIVVEPRPPTTTLHSPRRVQHFRYQSVNTHAASDRDKEKRMASATQKETIAEREAQLASMTRAYRPPHGTVSTFLNSKQTITPRESETMNESVDIYLAKLKASCLHYSTDTTLHELRFNEIPNDLHSPWTQAAAPRGPIKVRKAFDRSKVYKSHQKPLSVVLPNLFITRHFKRYIDQNHERMPQILDQCQ